MTDQPENPLIAERRRKLDGLREKGGAFPNDFRKNAQAAELHDAFGNTTLEKLEADPVRVSVAGRMMAKRVMGKASFVRLKDMTGDIQLFLQRDGLPEGVYADFKTWDVGDIVGGEGVLFRTRTGELSVRCDALRLLSKSLRPLPEKYHGLQDREMRYRQRYVDLAMSEESRAVFRTRTEMIRFMRDYLDARAFLEVETPMMQTIPGGANARPFITHHNALNMPLYLRIAPELFLKRLVVGGFERVYEINRNFRNEGLSTKHNPEFTMLEVYHAYADGNDMMNITEHMIATMAQAVLGRTQIDYQGTAVDLGQAFRRVSIEDALVEHNPDMDGSRLRDRDYLAGVARGLRLEPDDDDGPGKLQMDLFEATVEETLVAPTFVTGFPAEVSPLARRNDEDPFIADRFELFIAGRELANGFSELNDPEDQAARFQAQVDRKAGGDEEAMFFDADYIRALEYGMPPAGGLGVGIDRLVMLFTDQASIRDVLLFPHMRPERGTGTGGDGQPGDDPSSTSGE